MGFGLNALINGYVNEGLGTDRTFRTAQATNAAKRVHSTSVLPTMRIKSNSDVWTNTEKLYAYQRTSPKQWISLWNVAQAVT